jgi:multiple sugar transport system ATP-binding protein
MSSIQIDNVTKRFGNFTAVDGLSLDIKDGEFVALLGPSGCGKTTTMNMIAGLEDPNEGAIRFGAQSLAGMRIQDRNIGFVFQNYAIFTHLSVWKNLAYGLEVKRVPRNEIDRRVKAMAQRMNLTHRLDQTASKLSVNELQKLAIGRFRAYMRAELKVLQHEFGQTMIYVTHDQIEAMSLADKIAIIDKGKLMQYGAPLEIYNNPRNRFVANFVGSPRMNLIDGELREETGSLKLMVHGGAEIALSGRVRKDMLDGQRHAGVSLGVRAQDIYLGNRRAADDIEMRGVVEVLERVGPRRLAYIQVLQTIFLVIDDQDQLHVGDEVPFFLPSEKCMAFDLSSGLRLGAA